MNNYKDLSNSAIYFVAKQLCWDSISDEQRKEYLKQAEIIYNKKLQDIAIKCAEDAEKYCK